MATTVSRAAESTLEAGGLAVFVPMSGGVQESMLKEAHAWKYVSLVNPYLTGELPADLADLFLVRNAHPACTDFYAARRMAQAPTARLHRPFDLLPIWRAQRAVARMSAARILMIGETEPWVINSCRSPEVVRDRFGTDVITIPLEELYEEFSDVHDAEAGNVGRRWNAGASELVALGANDITKASRVAVALERLLDKYDADGLAVFRLRRHHESGRGVSPEVDLPDDQPVTLARLGNNFRQISVHAGRTEHRPRMHACNTQIRVRVESTARILESLLGTHVVMTYGDFTTELAHFARLLDIEVL